MQKLFLFALIACLCTMACKKTEVPVGFNDPVFMVTYEDTILHTITAGLNGVYHFTKYERGGNVFHSINTFANANCPAGDCPGSLSFEFIGNALADSAFLGPNPGTNPFSTYFYTRPDSISNKPESYTTRFSWGDIFQNFPEQEFMLVNDTVSYQSPVQYVDLDLPNNPVEVSLKGVGSNGLNCALRRTVLPSDKSQYPGISIVATPNGNVYNLIGAEDLEGSTVDIYHWNTGDSSFVAQTDSLSPLQEYTITATDAQGRTAVASIGPLPYPPQKVIRTAGLSYDVTPRFNKEQLGTVAIQWVDGSGTIWRSDWGNQPKDYSRFKVLSSMLYESNEFGDRVRKLQVEFKCNLYNSDGAFMPFFGSGVVGMARP